MDAKSRQIIAFHVGDRSRQSVKALWKSIPQCYRKHATFNTAPTSGVTSNQPAVTAELDAIRQRDNNIFGCGVFFYRNLVD